MACLFVLAEREKTDIYDRWTRIRRPLLCHVLLRRNNSRERDTQSAQTLHFCYSVPYFANESKRVSRGGERGQTNTAISFFLLFWVAKRKVTRATGRQRKLSTEYFMRTRKYECLTTCTGMPWKFTTLRDGTARFCRECKFVSCYLHEVERCSHSRFPQAFGRKRIACL